MRQQCCRSGLFFPYFWKWQGICFQILFRSRSSSKFAQMGSAGRSHVHSPALQAQQQPGSPDQQPWLSLLCTPCPSCDILMGFQDARCHQSMLSVVPSTVTGAQLPCRVGTLHCPRLWLVELLQSPGQAMGWILTSVYDHLPLFTPACNFLSFQDLKYWDGFGFSAQRIQLHLQQLGHLSKLHNPVSVSLPVR